MTTRQLHVAVWNDDETASLLRNAVMTAVMRETAGTASHWNDDETASLE